MKSDSPKCVIIPSPDNAKILLKKMENERKQKKIIKHMGCGMSLSKHMSGYIS